MTISQDNFEIEKQQVPYNEIVYLLECICIFLVKDVPFILLKRYKKKTNFIDLFLFFS